VAKLLSALCAKRVIKHNRLVCIGGVKLAALDSVSFDAIILVAITPTVNKGHLELYNNIAASQSAYRLVCLSVRNFDAKYLEN